MKCLFVRFVVRDSFLFLVRVYGLDWPTFTFSLRHKVNVGDITLRECYWQISWIIYVALCFWRVSYEWRVIVDNYQRITTICHVFPNSLHDNLITFSEQMLYGVRIGNTYLIWHYKH